MKTIGIRTRLGIALAASAMAFCALSGTSQAGPHVGQCKVITQTAVGASPAHAQQAWIALVAGKFGSKWAQWAGAKNKVVIPINNGTLYQAQARPCFYQPVL